MVHAESIPKASLDAASRRFHGHGEIKANMLSCLVPIRSCRVTVQDLDGITHTVEVTAESLYEAVAQGLAAPGAPIG